MKIRKLFFLAAIFLCVGCATVKVQAPKEPIKVDVTMRLDIYQHVQNDITAIEDIVTGAKSVPVAMIKVDLFAETAYAEDFAAGVTEAALRRKARYGQLTSLESSGVIGENSAGLVVVRSGSDATAGSIVNDENSDRMLIYKEIATKNGVSVADVQKIYAERLQGSAPAGTPVQSADGQWRTK